MSSKVEIPLSSLSRKNRSQVLTEGDVIKDKTIEEKDFFINGSASAKNRVGVTTLGCKVNTYESELISEAFKGEGWSTVDAKDEADMYIINTCTVTNEADKQARREVRKAVRRNPDAMVVVTGCYAQIDPEACAEIPGVDFVVGNDRKLDIHSLLPQLQSGDIPKVLVGDLDEHISLPEQVLTSYEGRTRAFIQIQQGCDQGCTFCIIHVARGKSRSLPLTLIRLAIEVPENPDFRIRLSSIDPVHITDELIQLFVDEPRLCNHIHLSLQSGSTLILKRMKRRYDREFLYNRIQTFRKSIPELVISADVMVGFPTESHEDFLNTEKSLIDLDVAFPHVFSYSIREGTPAARIPEAKQVTIEDKKARSVQLRELAKTLQADLYKRRLNTTAWGLPESNDGRLYKARSEDYLTVSIQSDIKLAMGEWVLVNYTGIDNNTLTAKIA